MLNFLALLGWSPGNDIEVMTLDRMIELFDVDGLQKKAAIFDPKKLEWMNGQHLSMISTAELLERVIPALEAEGYATRTELEGRRDWLLGLLDLLKVRARTIDDIVRQASPYFRGAIVYDPDAVAKQWKDRAGSADILASARETLASVADWSAPSMEEALRGLTERLGFGDKAGKVFQPLRVALTGLAASPGIFDVLVVLGRDRSLTRIDDAVAWLRAASPSSPRRENGAPPSVAP
jgi:glutamyl-tRNA synthetase